MEAVRQFLRRETVGEHLRVDSAVSKLDLAERDGLRRFICIHNKALRLIDASWDVSDLIDIRALISLTEQDLSVLGTTPPKVVTESMCYTEHLGPAYVLAGSHFGKRVLHGRWMRTSDPVVQRASSFLCTDILAQSWHQVMSVVEQSPTAARARIAAAARRTFNIYHTVIQDCLSCADLMSPVPLAEQAHGTQ
jgi:heme oxygenase